MDAIERFMKKVAPTDENGCWNWTAAQDGHGYGQFMAQRPVPSKAYRWSYENLVGPIPPGMQIDHLCRNRLCVNPDHLEPVTPRENWIRGEAPSARAVREGTCQRGHSMDNAIVKPNGDRTCRTCENERQRRYYNERKTTNV